MSCREETRIGLGSCVELEGPEGIIRVQLVSPVEVDLEAGRISVESPLGRALLGRRASETIQAETPQGILVFDILTVARRG